MKVFTRLDEYQKAFGINDLFDIKFARPGIAVVSRLGERTNEEYKGAIYEAPVTAPEVPENKIEKVDFSKGYEITADDNGNVISFAYNVDPETKNKVLLAGRQAEGVFLQYFGALYQKLQQQVEHSEPKITPIKRDDK